MTQDECETFLAQPHVAVMSVQRDDLGPLSVPVWYAYEPGGSIEIWSGSNSAKLEHVRHFGRFTICVQRDEPPYKYVSVEGPVDAIETIDYDRELQPLVFRYLGREEGKQFLADLGGREGAKEDVLIRMSPEHWVSEDFSKADEQEQ